MICINEIGLLNGMYFYCMSKNKVSLDMEHVLDLHEVW